MRSSSTLPPHHHSVAQLSDEHMKKLVDLWAERCAEIRKDENIKYIFIFENRGSMVGTSMPHPHGQIYGYSVIPKKLQLELASAQEYRAEKGPLPVLRYAWQPSGVRQTHCL